MNAFYLAQWEEFYSGKLVLGYIGVTEAQLISVGLFFTTAYFGPAFWATPFTILGFQLTFGDVPLIAGVLSSCATIVTNFYDVIRLPGVRIFQALFGTFSIGFLSFLFLKWAFVSPLIYLNHIHAFSLCYGLLAAHLIGRVVLARVCHQPFPYPLHPLLLPVVFIVGFIYSPG